MSVEMSASKILTLEGASSPLLLYHGNLGCQVFKGGIQNKINTLSSKNQHSKEIEVSKTDFQSQFSKSKSISIFLTFRIEQYHIFCDCYFLITSIFKTLHVLLTSRYQVYLQNTTISFKVRIFWEGHLLLTTVHKTKVRWRFCKTLWSSQSIWTSIRLILGQNSHLILYASLENLTTHIAYHLTFYARLWFFFASKPKFWCVICIMKWHSLENHLSHRK